METKNINLLQFRGNKSTLFTGRPQGEEVRLKLDLTSLDKKDILINFIIPSGTTSFNPSFYLGLLFDSIKTLGKEKFEEKYQFIIEDSNESVSSLLLENLEDGKRNAINTIEHKTGFKRFFNK